VLLDLKRLLADIGAVWDEYRQGGTGLLAATAMTNACVRHAKRLLSMVRSFTPQRPSAPAAVPRPQLHRAPLNTFFTPFSRT
jgi:hypothetical protein